MGAPPAELVLLREVVGPGPDDAVLRSAWQRSGGDLAAAVNIVLDAPRGPAATSSSGPRVPAATSSSAAISLDDSDEEADAAAVTTRPAEAPQTRAEAPQVDAATTAAPAPSSSVSSNGGRSGGVGIWRRMMDASAKVTTKATNTKTSSIAERPWKRLRPSSGAAAVSTPARSPIELAACNIEWALHLGSFSVNGYSTTKLSPEQQFPTGPDGSTGPLLSSGARLELKWNVDAKRPKGRPGTAAASVGYETGTVRFDVLGREVGKFPTWVARALVPLLARRLINIEAVLDHDPPRYLELGSNVPVVVRVSLRSSALGNPGQRPTGAGSNSSNGKIKGQKGVQKEEAEKEVQRTATAMLLEKLRLPCRRRAALAEVESGARDASGGNDEATATGASLLCEEEQDEPEEMSKQAAAQLGKSDHLERFDLPGIILPEGVFGATLRPYQAQAVYWMWQQENPTSKLPACFINRKPHASAPADAERTPHSLPASAEVQQPKEPSLHPMWDEYELPEATGPLPGGRASSRFLYHHRTTGALSLDFPDAALAHCRGGILADDMGLGKTVMCLALVSLDFAPKSLPSARTAAPELRALEDAEAPVQQKANLPSSTQKDNGVGGVLVVAPLSLIRQWNAEIQRHFPVSSRPSVHEFHGSGARLTAEQLSSIGIVLTTYGTLSSQPEDGAIFQVYWRRVILDEAHTIKNRCSRQAQAAFRLRSFCRWCVTGTPLQNSVEELYASVRFLRIEPWSAWPCWRKSVTIPLERGRQGDSEAMAQALDSARRIITPLIIRRTKFTVDPSTGKPLLELPRKHVHVEHLQLSLAERDFYDALWNKAKTQFDSFVAAGEALSKYTHILQLLLKLRQALCHPFLVFAQQTGKDEDMESLEKRCLQEMTGSDGVSDKFVGKLLEDLRNGELGECPICCESPEDPTMTPCGHIYCRDCAFKIIKQCSGECPVCRKPGITIKTLKVLPGASRFPARLLAKANEGTDASASSETCDSAHSTKMRRLLVLLRKDMEEGHRAVVFSQWTSFLDLIGSALESSKIPFKRFDGSLSLEQRADRVAWLSESGEGGSGARVLLVSLKSGGTGLNLVAASRLYLMDMWWNPAVEEQAIQRVHRIGQKQEVHIYRFVVNDSIDIDLVELHRAKERLLEDALRGGAMSEAATKLTMDDLKRLFSPCRTWKQGGGAASEAKALESHSAGVADLGTPAPEFVQASMTTDVAEPEDAIMPPSEALQESAPRHAPAMADSSAPATTVQESASSAPVNRPAPESAPSHTPAIASFCTPGHESVQESVPIPRQVQEAAPISAPVIADSSDATLNLVPVRSPASLVADFSAPTMSKYLARTSAPEAHVASVPSNALQVEDEQAMDIDASIAAQEDEEHMDIDACNTAEAAQPQEKSPPSAAKRRWSATALLQWTPTAPKDEQAASSDSLTQATQPAALPQWIPELTDPAPRATVVAKDLRAERANLPAAASTVPSGGAAAASQAWAPAWEAGGEDLLDDGEGAVRQPTGAAAPIASQAWAPAWEAGGRDLLLDSGADCTGMGSWADDDDLSDSDLLAACDAMEAHASQACPALAPNPAAIPLASACWAAMPLDDED